MSFRCHCKRAGLKINVEDVVLVTKKIDLVDYLHLYGYIRRKEIDLMKIKKIRIVKIQDIFGSLKRRLKKKEKEDKLQN